MKGLVRNNFYASFSNIKWYSVIMLLLGIFVIAMDREVPSLLINYTLICMAGFSFNAISCMEKENTSKWEKYKLTLPIKRTDIIKSHYVNHTIWILTGFFFAVICVSLSIFLHGFPFDKTTDLLMLLVTGIAISLLLGAIFFPLYYLVGTDKKEAIATTSMLFTIMIFGGLIGLSNYFFAPMSPMQLTVTAILLAVISLCIYLLSYPLTVKIFRRKEY